jgi:hypothetical protein
MNPIAGIADILWPDTEAEVLLRAKLADLTGSTAAAVAWELFALREHALDVMYSMIFEGRQTPPETSRAIHAQLESRVAPVPLPPMAEQWRSNRDALYTAIMPGGPEDRPFAAIWQDWLGRVAEKFASVFERHDAAAGRIGADEYDKAAKQLFPLCRQLK